MTQVTRELLELAERVEKAEGADRELDCLIEIACGKDGPAIREVMAGSPHNTIDEVAKAADRETQGLFFRVPDFTASIDAAMSLVPESATNMSITQFGRGWTVTFHDTAQKMGERAAHEEIERLLVQHGCLASALRGEPRVTMEKAIAEHWLEFHCKCAATPALALVAAALRARSAATL